MLSKLAFKFMSHTRSLYTKSDRILVVHDDNLLYAHLLAEKLKSGTNITVANPSRVKDEDDGEDEAAAKGKCKGKGKGKGEGKGKAEGEAEAEAAAKGKCKGKGKGKGEGKGKGKAEGDAEAEAAKNSVKNKDKGESGIDRESFQQAGGGHRCKRLKLLGAQVFFGTNFSNLIEKITEKDFDKIVYVNRHKLNAEGIKRELNAYFTTVKPLTGNSKTRVPEIQVAVYSGLAKYSPGMDTIAGEANLSPLGNPDTFNLEEEKSEKTKKGKLWTFNVHRYNIKE